jgi:hypothetical protein
MVEKPIKGFTRGIVPTSAYGRLDEPYNAYLEKIDPRGDSPRSRALRHSLAVNPDAHFREFLLRLSEPRYKGYSLAAIAKTCDLSLPQFAEFYQKSVVQQALALAQQAVPELTEDLIEDARTTLVSCERCDGIGHIEAPEGYVAPGEKPTKKASLGRKVRTCPTCEGKGKVRRIGNEHARDSVLEMAGLKGKKGGGVQIVQNFGGHNIESAVDRLNQVTFDIPAEDISEVN